MGTDKMEQKVLGEVRNVIRKLKQRNSEVPIDIRDSVDFGIGSITYGFLFGNQYDDEKIKEFVGLYNLLAEKLHALCTPLGQMLSFFPPFQYLPYFRGINRELLKDNDKIMNFVDRQIAEHKELINYESDENTDYVEAFLKQMKKHENRPDFGGFEIIQLKNMLFDLCIAGIETTDHAIIWGILYILHYPQVANRMREELDSHIGVDRMITMEDKHKLPYVDAVVHESLRVANLGTLNIFNLTTKDVVINGYRIPKDTIIIPHIAGLFHDEEIFPEPYEFKPERFLDSNGHLKKIDEYIPFKIGKRRCVAESLGRVELFLFIANIYNQFEIQPVDPNDLPATKKTWGFIMEPQRFKVLLKPRYPNE